MKPIILLVALGTSMLSGIPAASAADLSPSVRRPAIAVSATRPTARVYVRRTVRRVVVRRTIGMPCVLPPHVIVQRDWNGPQCRWVDNVIPGDLRIRYRVAVR